MGLAEGPLRAVPGGFPLETQHSQHLYPRALLRLLSCRALEGSWRLTHMHTCLHSLSPGRRSLWLNIGGKEAAALSTCHISVPLPEVSGGITGPGRGCSLALS